MDEYGHALLLWKPTEYRGPELFGGCLVYQYLWIGNVFHRQGGWSVVVYGDPFSLYVSQIQGMVI